MVCRLDRHSVHYQMIFIVLIWTVIHWNRQSKAYIYKNIIWIEFHYTMILHLSATDLLLRGRLRCSAQSQLLDNFSAGFKRDV